jgi:hypothetical protein
VLMTDEGQRRAIIELVRLLDDGPGVSRLE